MIPLRNAIVAVVACAWLMPAWAEPLEVLHVRANTGGSAGGHVALRVGDDVFHYQAGRDMLLYLHRDRWHDFVYRYAVLDNRPIHATVIDVGQSESALLRRELDRLHVTQLQHHDRLHALDVQSAWLAARRGEAASVYLPAVGYFADRDGGAAHARVVPRIEALHGERFLRDELAGIENRLAEFEPDRDIELPVVGEFLQQASAATDLRDLVALREALRILDGERSVSNEALNRPGVAPLSGRERALIAALRESVGDDIVRLLRSPRPDRGNALLMSLARYESLSLSLAENGLVLLDANPDDFILHDEDDVRRNREMLRAMARQNADSWRRIRGEALGGEAVNIWQLTRLEEAATKYSEIRDAADHGHAIRGWEPNLLGEARRGAVVVEPAPGADSADAVAEEYRVALYGIYGYDLLDHNCSTELRDAIRAAVEGDASLEARLPVEEGLTLIPSVLAGLAARDWPVKRRYRVPSWREWRVEEGRDHANDVVVALRESNTLTAREYEGSMIDDAFLLFADGTPWLRPLQGVGNVLWGVGNMAVGVVSMPFDDARRLKAGASGAFYSAPEIIGFNIRKGRYDVAPPDAALRLIEAAR